MQHLHNIAQSDNVDLIKVTNEAMTSWSDTEFGHA